MFDEAAFEGHGHVFGNPIFNRTLALVISATRSESERCWLLVFTITVVIGDNSFVNISRTKEVFKEPNFGSDWRHGATVPVSQHDLKTDEP